MSCLLREVTETEAAEASAEKKQSTNKQKNGLLVAAPCFFLLCACGMPNAHGKQAGIERQFTRKSKENLRLCREKPAVECGVDLEQKKQCAMAHSLRPTCKKKKQKNKIPC